MYIKKIVWKTYSIVIHRKWRMFNDFSKIKHNDRKYFCMSSFKGVSSLDVLENIVNLPRN